MPTVPERIRTMVDRWSDETAHRVVDGPELTFGEWWSRSGRLARGLRDRGVGHGDRVMLLFEADDLAEHLVTYLAVHRLGAINVLVNKRFGGDEVARLVDHAEPAAVVASGGLYRLLEEAGVDGPEHVGRVVTTDGSGGSETWKDLLTHDHEGPDVSVTEDDAADVLYTSGTTGRPKGVLTRHRNATQAPDELPDDFRGTGWLHASPLESLAGISFIVTPPALGMTATFLPPPFDPHRWLSAVEQGEVTAAYVVPSMVEQLLAVGDVQERDLSSLTLVTVGSAPIAPATLRRFNDLLPNATPQISYSLTELGTGFTVMPEDEFEDHLESVGKPMPPLEIRIVDPDSGDERSAGEVGEVLARVEGSQREYFRRPDLTEEAFDDGWFHTGDAGYVDEDGFLYLEGRLDEVIMRGGYNIHPVDPERAIYEDDRVQEAAVFGVPDDTLGEIAVAAVVPKPDVDLTPEEVRRGLEDRLGEAKRPDRIEVVEALPRNADGKVLKRELSSRFG